MSRARCREAGSHLDCGPRPCHHVNIEPSQLPSDTTNFRHEQSRASTILRMRLHGGLDTGCPTEVRGLVGRQLIVAISGPCVKIEHKRIPVRYPSRKYWVRVADSTLTVDHPLGVSVRMRTANKVPASVSMRTRTARNLARGLGDRRNHRTDCLATSQALYPAELRDSPCHLGRTALATRLGLQFAYERGCAQIREPLLSLESSRLRIPFSMIRRSWPRHGTKIEVNSFVGSPIPETALLSDEAAGAGK